MRQGYHKQKFCFYSVSEMQQFYATGYTFGPFLCDRLQGVERFPTHPVTSLAKYPPESNRSLVSPDAGLSTATMKCSLHFSLAQKRNVPGW